MKSRVLLVDDSPSALLGLRRLLEEGREFEVVGEARTGAEAVAMARELRPDLVTMDVFLGGQDGVDVTRSILAAVATRIVLVTGLDPARANLAFRGLAAGALDVLRKPAYGEEVEGGHQRKRFLSALGSLARVGIVGKRRPSLEEQEAASPAPTRSQAVFALGASTGGPAALFKILENLPRPFPVPIVIVQHIEPDYVTGLAEWLQLTGHNIVVANQTIEPQPGCVYLAPGKAHLRLSRTNLLVPSPGEARRFQLPSIDELFESMALKDSSRTFAVLLTGMGEDGAEGLARLAQAGATTAVQSLESCVVPGIPAAGLRAGGASIQLSPEEIAAAARRFFSQEITTKEGFQT